jgi:AmmeMemoRadiSam system protein B
MLERGTRRPPALAGAWYAASPQLLAQSVRDYLAAANPLESLVHLDTLVAPHAGHSYSGRVAGKAWGAVALTPRAVAIERVVIVGPAHRLAFDGVALGDFEVFEHPLGPTRVDRAALASLERLGLGSFVPGAHDSEHCIEIELPFLALALPGVPIVPLLIGHGPERALAARVDAVLEATLGATDLLVVSSDLSHFRPYDEARALDCETMSQILRLDPSIDSEQACGYRGVQAAIRRAQRHALRGEFIDYETSGDTAGDRRSVVGYGALAFGAHA